MGKFAEGFERARKAAEEREAAARRRAEQIERALKELSDRIGEDGGELSKLKITTHIEHGALVLKRLLQPLAGVTFEPESNRYKIHEYSVTTEGKTEMDADDADECALKLGEYAYSLKS